MNYYQILKINKNATSEEIKKHYYRLARKYHPDKTNGNIEQSEKFKLLSEAYSTLSNPKKRYLYDLKNNLNVEIDLNFAEEEYELLHHYYQKMMDSTEIKFIRLLFTSLPKHIQSKIKHKFKELLNLGERKYQSNQSSQLMNLSDIKYINILKLKENYKLNLFRKFDDIYNNKLKQIIIIGQSVLNLFITSYNYSINIPNDKYSFQINFLGDLGNFRKKGFDLIYEKKINLYQYYYGDSYSLVLNNNKYYFQNTFNKNHIMEHLGLKDPLTGKRGNLYINYSVDLNKHNLNKYQMKELMCQIFNI